MFAQALLIIDAGVNLLLGALLIWFPLGLARALGLPEAGESFYPRLLGAVLFGIGVALLIEGWANEAVAKGLGLAGAVAINLCGAAVLMWLLATSRVGVSGRGKTLLWALTGILIGLSVVEVLAV